MKDKIYNHLDSLDIDYIKVNHAPLLNLDDCNKIQELNNKKLCKNLYLTTTNGNTRVFLIIDADKKFKTSIVSHKLGTSRLSFSSSDDTIAHLKTMPGSLSIMSLLFRENNNILLAIDKDVIDRELYLCHPCINNETLIIKSEEIKNKLIPSLNIEYKIIDI